MKFSNYGGGSYRLENEHVVLVWRAESGRPLGSIGPRTQQPAIIELSAEARQIYRSGDEAAIRSAMLDTYLEHVVVQEAIR